MAYLNDRDRLVIDQERPRVIIGTPDLVADRAAELADLFAADEVVILTVAPDYAARLRSYEVLAAAMAATAVA